MMNVPKPALEASADIEQQELADTSGLNGRSGTLLHTAGSFWLDKKHQACITERSTSHRQQCMAVGQSASQVLLAWMHADVKDREPAPPPAGSPSSCVCCAAVLQM